MDNARYQVKVGFKNDGDDHRRCTPHPGSAEKGFAHIGSLRGEHEGPQFASGVERRRLQHIPGLGHPVRAEHELFCFSAVLNHVAEALGMDPTELALKNDGCEGHPMADLGGRRSAARVCETGTASGSVWRRARRPWSGTKKWHLPGTKKLPNGRMHGIGLTLGSRVGRFGRLGGDRHPDRAGRRLGPRPGHALR